MGTDRAHVKIFDLDSVLFSENILVKHPITVRVRIPWYLHYYPLTAGRKIEHHEKAHASRFYRALAFRSQDDEPSRKPDSDMRTMPLGSLVSKVNTNQHGTG